jgi:outer membrane protein TolC
MGTQMQALGKCISRSRGLFPLYLLAAFLSLAGPAPAAELTFDSVLTQAMDQAHDLKIARTDLEISRYRLDETRSLYYPTFDFQLYNEYVHVPDENAEGIVSVGTSVSTALESTYQHSVVASLNYELYDFGARGLKHKNALRELDIARLNLDQSRVDLKLQVLEAYTLGLRLFRQQETAGRVLSLRKEIYRSAQQLKEAGVVGTQRVESLALELADALGRSDDLETEFQNALNALAFFTKEAYRAEETAIAGLPVPAQEGELPEVGRLPEIRAIEAEIEGKRTEMEIARKEMLPRLVAYGAYRMYGSDTNSFVQSLQNITERDATVAVVAEWNLFSGFRDLSKVRRLKAEIKRLAFEKEKRAAELERDIQDSYQAHRLLAARDEQWQKRRSRIRQSREIDKRLSRQQIIDRIAYLENEVDRAGYRLDLALKEIDRAFAGLKLSFWREGQRK